MEPEDILCNKLNPELGSHEYLINLRSWCKGENLVSRKHSGKGSLKFFDR